MKSNAPHLAELSRLPRVLDSDEPVSYEKLGQLIGRLEDVGELVTGSVRELRAAREAMRLYHDRETLDAMGREARRQTLVALRFLQARLVEAISACSTTTRRRRKP